MGKHPKDEVARYIFSLRKSIRLVPIEFQLMYFYLLLTFVYANCVDNYFYTNFNYVKEKLPDAYKDVIDLLRTYRNTMVHEGIIKCLDTFAKLRDSKIELDSIAALVNVELNWDNSLNIDLEGDS